MFDSKGEEILREARSRVREVVRKFDSLPAGESFTETNVREKLITSAVRWNYSDARSRVARRESILPIFLLLLLAGWISLIALLPVSRAIPGVVIYMGGMSGATGLLIKFSGRFWRLRFLTGIFRFLVGAALVAVSATVYSVQLYAIHPKPIWVSLGSFSGGIAATLLWLLCLFTVNNIASYLKREDAGLKRYDAALVNWVEATFLVYHLRAEIQRFDTLNECLFRVELTARNVESAGHLARVPGLLEPHRKAVIRDEAQRMAEVFRNHKSALAKVSRFEDVDAIPESMLAGVKALAIGDTCALLENAPDRITRSDRLRRFAVWILPPVMLISAGLLLPLIPAVASQGVAVGSLRWSLIIAGVLSVVAAQKDVAARVNDTLGKAMTWK